MVLVAQSPPVSVTFTVRLKLDEGDMQRLDEVSALAPESPGWMLARQGAGRRPADFEPKE